jgi:hypothetical protein
LYLLLGIQIKEGNYMDIKAKFYTRTNDSGTHYARVILPKELRPKVAKPAVWRSLSTKDNAEAKEAGIVTALASRTVFQEAADNLLAKAKVIVDAEILGEKINLDSIADKHNEEEVTRIADSLRQSFGITATTSPAGNSSGSSGSSQGSSSDGSSTVKTAKKKTAPGQPSTPPQNEAAPILNDDVAHYLEKRPHGYYRLRFWIPRPLHTVAGQREVRLTLGTKDREQAIIKALPMVRDIHKNIERLRHKTAPII